MQTNNSQDTNNEAAASAPTATALEALHFRVKQAQERRRQKRKRIHA
ncbi:hypothetical protein [Hymenobacter elongatus]|nr:hypothetical protein [Hymenobacter elongatus]